MLGSSPARIGATRSSARRARLAEACTRHEARGLNATEFGNRGALLFARQILLTPESGGSLNGKGDGVVPFGVGLELG